MQETSNAALEPHATRKRTKLHGWIMRPPTMRPTATGHPSTPPIRSFHPVVRAVDAVRVDPQQDRDAVTEAA
jgi:hypothetical protein